MMNSSMKLVLRSVVTTLGNASRLGGIGVVQEGSNRYFGAKGGGGNKGAPVFRKPGPSGRVLVCEDHGATFTKSITRAGADDPGAEHGNKIFFVTREVSIDSFNDRYHLGKNNLKAARSSAGENGLTEVYGVDSTRMHEDPELIEFVAKKKFRRVYIIHPRYTDWDKVKEKEEKIAAGGGVSNPKPRDQALKSEEEIQNLDYVIKDNKEFMKAIFKSVFKLIDRDSRVLVLHPTAAPYSLWDIKGIAHKAMFEAEKDIPFDPALYTGFSPRRAGSDLDLGFIPSVFTPFKIRDLKPGEVVEEEEKEEKEKTAGKENHGDKKQDGK